MNVNLPENLTIAIPTRVLQPRAHSFSADDSCGQFESVTGARLWELSTYEIPAGKGGPSDDELERIERAG